MPSRKTWTLIISSIAVIVALWYFGIIEKVKAWLAGTKEGGEGGAPAPTVCSFPVTIESSDACIIEAFKKSGYLDDLQRSITSGLYPKSYMDSALANPRAWLSNHPYLFNMYPQWFKALSSLSGTPTQQPQTQFSDIDSIRNNPYLRSLMEYG